MSISFIPKFVNSSFLLLFLLLQFHTNGFSNDLDTLFLSAEPLELVLEKSKLKIFEDTTASFGLSEIDKLSPIESAYTRKAGAAYWVKFVLKNTDYSGKRWYLEAIDPRFINVTLFELSNEGYKESQQMGSNRLFSNRPFYHKNFIFNINIKSEKSKTFYFRVQSNIRSPLIFKVRSGEYLLSYSVVEYYLLGLFYGILVIIALYNLFLFISIRERVYLFYVFYVIACACSALNEDGTGFQFIWPYYPYFNTFLINYSQSLLLVAFVIYSIHFLEINKIKSKFFFSIVISSVVYLIYKAFVLTLGSNYEEFLAIYFLPFILVYVAAIEQAFKRSRSAILFLAGYSFIVFSVLLSLLRISGFAEGNAWSVYGLNFGFVIEVLILSYALSDKMKQAIGDREKYQKQVIAQLQENEKLKDEINQSLEKKVEERTLELHYKNLQLEDTKLNLEKAFEQLQQQAEEITAMNDLLHEDNRVLKLDLEQQSKAKVMFEDTSYDEFNKIYPDEASCLSYLAEIKWKSGYQCKRCSNSTFFEGRTLFSKRCTKCGYEESATAYTILHRSKVPINKAFYMVYLVSTQKQEITSEELSKILDLRQKTCWSFKQKVVSAINKFSLVNNRPYKKWGELLLEDVTDDF